MELPACRAAIGRFNQLIVPLIQELGDSIAVFLISADLPFAQVRWQVTEGIDNITLLSDYRDLDFARNWGLLVQELGLLASSIYLVDHNGVVSYREIVSELTAELNYQAALAHLAVSETVLKRQKLSLG